MTAKVRRRLTTLLCADVKGYTRLMEADEPGTLATLRRYRDAMATLVERHDGRVVNTWGDAVIAEFPSVVEAVQCAIETQQEIAGYNGELPESRKMRFRIGIHLGDVMVEGDDVYGDGVNVAARLQELAEPGGILISQPVYDQVRTKVAIGFQSVGEQRLKNVENPVTGYRIVPGGAHSDAPADRAMPAAQPAGAAAPGPEWLRRVPRQSASLIAVAIFLFLINAFTGFHSVWFQWPASALVLVAIVRAIYPRKES